ASFLLATPATLTYTLSLHDALPICPTWVKERPRSSPLLLYSWETTYRSLRALRDGAGDAWDDVALEYTHPQTGGALLPTMSCGRSEEHTSELQSRSELVCRLPLAKK